MGGCFRSPKTTPWASTLISIQRLRDLDFALVESVLDQPPSTQQRAFLLAKNYLFVRKKRRDHYIREARRILVKTSNKTFISVVSQPPSTQQRALALEKVFISVQKTQRVLHSGSALHFGQNNTIISIVRPRSSALIFLAKDDFFLTIANGA